MEKPNPPKNLSLRPWSSSQLPSLPSSPESTNSHLNRPPSHSMAASKNQSWRSRRLLPSRSRSKNQEAPPMALATVPGSPAKNQELTSRTVLLFPCARSPRLSRRRSSSPCILAPDASGRPARCLTEWLARTFSPGPL